MRLYHRFQKGNKCLTSTEQPFLAVLPPNVQKTRLKVCRFLIKPKLGLCLFLSLEFLPDPWSLLLFWLTSLNNEATSPRTLLQFSMRKRTSSHTCKTKSNNKTNNTGWLDHINPVSASFFYLLLCSCWQFVVLCFTDGFWRIAAVYCFSCSISSSGKQPKFSRNWANMQFQKSVRVSTNCQMQAKITKSAWEKRQKWSFFSE